MVLFIHVVCQVFIIYYCWRLCIIQIMVIIFGILCLCYVIFWKFSAIVNTEFTLMRLTIGISLIHLKNIICTLRYTHGVWNIWPRVWTLMNTLISIRIYLLYTNWFILLKNTFTIFITTVYLFIYIWILSTHIIVVKLILVSTPFFT